MNVKFRGSNNLTRLNILVKIGIENVSIIRVADDIMVITVSKGDTEFTANEIN